MPELRHIVDTLKSLGGLICNNLNPFSTAPVWQLDCLKGHRPDLSSLSVVGRFVANHAARALRCVWRTDKHPNGFAHRQVVCEPHKRTRSTTNDVIEIGQIQHKLQGKGEDQHWSFCRCKNSAKELET